jgi:hypothetical protein
MEILFSVGFAETAATASAKRSYRWARLCLQNVRSLNPLWKAHKLVHKSEHKHKTLIQVLFLEMWRAGWDLNPRPPT